jgi:hypothetical protein
MVRTQIQLPDHLYEQLKRLAALREMSLTELVRRSLEHTLSLAPKAPDPGWQLPKAVALGAFRADVEDWRELAQA